MNTVTYVRLDGQKATVCVAFTESHSGGELRQLSVSENRPDSDEAGSAAEQSRSLAQLLL